MMIRILIILLGAAGFVFLDSPPSFGLRQTCGGGPCGVLAGVQCALLKELLFSKEDGNNGARESLPVFTQDEVYDAFSRACVAILFRASNGGPITLVDCLDTRTLNDLALYSPASDFVVHNFVQSDDAIQFVRQRVGRADQLFGSRVGCILFVMSLLLSRGLSEVANDFDDATNTLIGPFGHCNQVGEHVINLNVLTHCIPDDLSIHPSIHFFVSTGVDEFVADRTSHQ